MPGNAIDRLLEAKPVNSDLAKVKDAIEFIADPGEDRALRALCKTVSSPEAINFVIKSRLRYHGHSYELTPDFVSALLSNPHLTADQYKTLVEKFGKKHGIAREFISRAKATPEFAELAGPIHAERKTRHDTWKKKADQLLVNAPPVVYIKQKLSNKYYHRVSLKGNKATQVSSDPTNTHANPIKYNLYGPDFEGYFRDDAVYALMQDDGKFKTDGMTTFMTWELMEKTMDEFGYEAHGYDERPEHAEGKAYFELYDAIPVAYVRDEAHIGRQVQS